MIGGLRHASRLVSACIHLVFCHVLYPVTGLSLTAGSRQNYRLLGSFVPATFVILFKTNNFTPLPGQIWLHGSLRIALQQYRNFSVALE